MKSVVTLKQLQGTLICMFLAPPVDESGTSTTSSRLKLKLDLSGACFVSSVVSKCFYSSRIFRCVLDIKQ